MLEGAGGSGPGPPASSFLAASSSAALRNCRLCFCEGQRQFKLEKKGIMKNKRNMENNET
jgi:hypothetical protein